MFSPSYLKSRFAVRDLYSKISFEVKLESGDIPLQIRKLNIEVNSKLFVSVHDIFLSTCTFLKSLKQNNTKNYRDSNIFNKLKTN